MSEEAKKGDRPPIIESASATTDPENSKSGSGAYVAFLVVVCLLLALVSSVTSCVGSIVDLAAESVERTAADGDLRLFDVLNDFDRAGEPFFSQPVSRT